MLVEHHQGSNRKDFPNSSLPRLDHELVFVCLGNIQTMIFDILIGSLPFLGQWLQFKKNSYILSFVVLDFLLRKLIHALIIICYSNINLLISIRFLLDGEQKNQIFLGPGNSLPHSYFNSKLFYVVPKTDLSTLKGNKQKENLTKCNFIITATKL